MRTIQHIIDTRAIKRVCRELPDHWVIRELTERDYGTDLLVEIFEDSGTDSYGHTVYTATGTMFHAQVKGTTSPLKLKKDCQIAFQLSKKAMLYTQSFSTPFLLIMVDLSSDDAESYFLWIQRYIRDVFDSKKPEWRALNQDSFAIRIPSHNKLSSETEKIKHIAARPRLIQELIEFKESYFHLSTQFKYLCSGHVNLNNETLRHLTFLAWQIRNLSIIFKYNNCCIDKSSAEELFTFISSLDVKSFPTGSCDLPHRANFELLSKSLEGIYEIENFIEESSSGTPY
jgi:hypothetical protein